MNSGTVKEPPIVGRVGAGEQQPEREVQDGLRRHSGRQLWSTDAPAAPDAHWPESRVVAGHTSRAAEIHRLQRSFVPEEPVNPDAELEVIDQKIAAAYAQLRAAPRAEREELCRQIDVLRATRDEVVEQKADLDNWAG